MSKEPLEQRLTFPTRRQVFGLLIGGAGLAAAATLFSSRRSLPTAIDYSVFDEAGDDAATYDDIIANIHARGVRLSNSRKVSATQSNNLWQKFKTYLNQDIQSLTDGKGKYKVDFKHDFYAFPLSESAAQTIAAHSNQCVDYLSEILPSLTLPPERLTIIRPGQDFSKDFASRTYVGGDLHKLYTAVVWDEHSDFTFERSFPSRMYGSIGAVLSPDQDPDNTQWYTFLSNGPSGYVAPIAERLPLITLRHALLHFPNEDAEAVITADESLVEPIAFIVAKKILPSQQWDKLDANLTNIMNTDPKYRYVRKSLQWMEQHSPAAALDVYFSEGPAAYLRKISA